MEEKIKNALAKIDVNALMCLDEENRFVIKTDRKALSVKCASNLVIWGIGSYVAHFMAFAAIVIVVGILAWDKQTGFAWGEAAIAVVPVGIVVGFGKPLWDERKRRKAEQERLEGECHYLAGLINDAQQKFDELTGITERAFIAVEIVKSDWENTSYGTFWDSAEQATQHFKEYENNIKFIEECATDYKERVARNELMVPRFELRIEGFPDIRNSVLALSEVVTQANRDYQFSDIHNSRKTNRLLEEGFANVAFAIRHMEGTLSSKIDDLSDTLGTKLDEIADISRAQNDHLASIDSGVRSMNSKLKNVNTNLKNMKFRVDVDVKHR